MANEIDWTKGIETDDSPPRKCRVLCTDLMRSDGYKYLVAVEQYDNYEAVYCFSADGHCGFPGPPRIRNVPEKFSRDVWVNVYPESNGCHGYPSKGTADCNAGPSRIACIKVTVEGHVGQFDD